MTFWQFYQKWADWLDWPALLVQPSISTHRKWPEMVVSASTNQVWTKITIRSYAWYFAMQNHIQAVCPINPILKIQKFPLSMLILRHFFFPDFVPSPWKIHKPYCYNVKPNLQVTNLFLKRKEVFKYSSTTWSRYNLIRNCLMYWEYVIFCFIFSIISFRFLPLYFYSIISYKRDKAHWLRRKWYTHEMWG